jgi:hypothetical protein
MVKVGTIIYSVDEFGGATPYIVWKIEEDFIVCCISITPARWNTQDRVCVEMEKIISNCFDENDAHTTDFCSWGMENDKKKINRYCKQRFNEK